MHGFYRGVKRRTEFSYNGETVVSFVLPFGKSQAKRQVCGLSGNYSSWLILSTGLRKTWPCFYSEENTLCPRKGADVSSCCDDEMFRDVVKLCTHVRHNMIQNMFVKFQTNWIIYYMPSQ